MIEKLQLRVQPADQKNSPTLVYVPGLHGDWTLLPSFRRALTRRVTLIEVTYPRDLGWGLEDYARAIETALVGEGASRVWLLGESFGSQVVWAMLERLAGASEGLRCDGVVLAGGFVRHPVAPLAPIAAWSVDHLPAAGRRLVLGVYAAYARFRHRHAPETLAGVHEFLARRTELDCHAMAQRLRLIARSDPRPVARRTHIPVYDLVGAIDPIVPWVPVRSWLRRNCPGYRGSRTVWSADHNVLSTAPEPAAEQVLRWLSENPIYTPKPAGSIPTRIS